MSREALSSRCQFSSTTLGRWERGESEPTLTQLREIMRELKVSSMELALADLHYRPAESADVLSAVMRLPQNVRKPMIELALAISDVYRR